MTLFYVCVSVCICVLCVKGVLGNPGLPGLIGREGPKVSAHSICISVSFLLKPVRAFTLFDDLFPGCYGRSWCQRFSAEH